MIDVLSFIIYSSILVVSTSFALLTSINSKNGLINNFCLLTSFFVIFISCSIRYDVGFDYIGYVDIFGSIKYNLKTYVEPGYYFINYIFKSSSIGYVYVFAVMSFITYFIIYKLFDELDILFYGVFYLFTLQFYFMINNQIRQGLAISIFLYSIKYLERSKYLLFAIFVLIMSLFHLSSIFLLLFIPLSRIKFSNKIWIPLIFLSYVLYYFGCFKSLFTELFSLIPYYDKYSSFAYRTVAENTNPLIVLYWVLISLYIAWNHKYVKFKIYFKIYMIGSVLYPIFIEYHLLNRINLYMFFTNVVVAALISKENNFRGLILMIVTFIVFSVYCLFNWGLDGGYPYQTIFTQQISKFL